MSGRQPVLWPVLLILALSPSLAAAAAPAPSLALDVEPRVKLASRIVVRGTAGEGGRLVLVVRNANGRVVGRLVRDRVSMGGFGARVPLNGAARPGPATVSAQLTGGGAFDPARATARFELVKVEPNFLAALRSPWPVDRPIPVRGRINFPGRLVLVARNSRGGVVGKAVVRVERKGAFTSALGITPGTRPGRVVVTGTLRSGSLVARGSAALILE